MTPPAATTITATAAAAAAAATTTTTTTATATANMIGVNLDPRLCRLRDPHTL